MRVLSFLDKFPSPANLEDAADIALKEAGKPEKEENLFNVGKSGRGKKIGKRRLNRVRRMAAYYKHVDFSRLGL